MISETFIDESRLDEALEKAIKPSKQAVMELLAKGRKLKGLTPEEAAVLLNAEGEEILNGIFETATYIKNTIYGDRLVFFAPLYLSNYCVNDCKYCGFHTRNKKLVRKKLSFNEIEEQTRYLINMGHK